MVSFPQAVCISLLPSAITNLSCWITEWQLLTAAQTIRHLCPVSCHFLPSAPTCARSPLTSYLLDPPVPGLLSLLTFWTHLCPVSSHFLPPGPKYNPQHPQPMFLQQCKRPSFTPIQKHRTSPSCILHSKLSVLWTEQQQLQLDWSVSLQTFEFRHIVKG